MAPDARTDGKERALNDTIFALSSGAPPAAIAIVRVSGPRADSVLVVLAGRLTAPRRAQRVTLAHSGERLDEALAIRFPGPRSATGEDLVELHLHGGRAVVAAVLDAVAVLPGMRPAEPGEFTRRAFENGRIDLAEAEGLSDLLMAETEAQRRAALSLAGGALSRQVHEWQQRILAEAGKVEAALDFSDEGDVDAAGPGGDALLDIAADIRAWLSRPPAERLKDGLRIVIAGPPNAGKSSLLNALAGREAAIISAVAGTTRDLVEAPVAIRGRPFVLIDTAGLRDSADQVESIGIARARDSLDAADLILWLGPPDDCPALERSLRIQSKIDSVPLDPQADIHVSALTGEGLNALVDRIVECSRALLPAENETAINARHRLLLAACLEHLEEAAGADDLLVAAEALRQGRIALDRITGRAGVEEMLDSLFARFCVGK